MPELAKKFENLSDVHKKEVIDVSLFYPNTSSLAINRSESIYNYSCNEENCDLDKVLEQIEKKPSNGILKDIIEVVNQNQESFSVKNLDYMVFQQTKTPILTLKNNTDKNLRFTEGISSFMDINGFEINLHRKFEFLESIITFDFWTVLRYGTPPLICALIFSGTYYYMKKWIIKKFC